MKHLKRFNQINESSRWDSIRGAKVVKADINNGTFVLETDKRTLKIACSGGNAVSLGAPGPKTTGVFNLLELKGTTVVDIQMVDSYRAYLKFDNGESINVYDDSGGEGIEMWLDTDFNEDIVGSGLDEKIKNILKAVAGSAEESGWVNYDKYVREIKNLF